MIIGTPFCFEDSGRDMPEKRDLAYRLISFFEENDSHARERAREEAAQKDVMQEAMEMLDSGLLLRAILEVLDRVRNEEPNFHKRNNYQMLMEDLEDFYNRQMSIEAFEEEKRHAKRDRFCR